ncbi:hypothetical protein, partial [Staphylococcus aureus]|uniref:hypothetical protein n=1 Tax=Staphylococcus aureus TaxID=1280 RepID=UPI001BAFC8E9
SYGRVDENNNCNPIINKIRLNINHPICQATGYFKERAVMSFINPEKPSLIALPKISTNPNINSDPKKIITSK